MRRKIVAGNWKMNGGVAFLQDYLDAFTDQLGDSGLGNIDVLIAPPLVLLSQLANANSGPIDLAAQNVSSYEAGAYTGEVSAGMLSELGCKWVIVGHSERRALFGESNDVVVEKVSRLLQNDIVPILCVGETLEERESGQAEAVVLEQLAAVLSAFGDDELASLVVAYEPVWAIGTGKTATPDQAQEMHAFIRQEVAKKSNRLADELRILYGGSVNAANAEELFGQKDIDGGLVGGASLKVGDFLQICKSAG